MPKEWATAYVEMRDGERTDITDRVGRLWVMALMSSQKTISAFEDLGNAMRRKAGIDGPSMWKEAREGWLSSNEDDAAELGGTDGGDCETGGR